MENYFICRLLFNHSVLAKAALGMDIAGTMQRFKVWHWFC